MLIQDTVKIKVSSTNSSYWSEKGYLFPKVGGRSAANGSHEIEVSTYDLLPNSNVMVWCMCDNCKKEYQTRFSRNKEKCGKCAASEAAKGNSHGARNIKYDIPSRDEYLRLRFEQKLSQEKIAAIFGVSIPVVRRWEEKLDIPYQNYLTRTDVPSKEELLKLHIEEKIPLSQIVKKFRSSPSVIKRVMQEYGIPIMRYRKGPRHGITKDELYRLHVMEKKSFKEIGEEQGVSGTMIGLLAKQWGIENINYANELRFDLTEEELTRLHYEDKLPFSEIARIKGMNDVTVGNYARRFGISCKYFPESIPEKELRHLLEAHNITCTKTRKLFEGASLEVDLYNEQHKIGIEFNGLYWHREDQRAFEKYKHLLSRGVRLITVFEDEWIEKREIVSSIILSKFRIFKRSIGARKCEVHKVPARDAKSFLDENHLQGSPAHFDLAFGLYLGEEMLACLCIGRHHRQKNEETVLQRVCFKKHTTVHGGFRKLLKAIPAEYFPLVTWSDNRWSEGAMYEKAGFELIASYKPDYSYAKNQVRKSKQSMTKKLTKCPPHYKEHEWNLINGWHRIWDCGKRKWKISKGV